jgi:hypothetical protein
VLVDTNLLVRTLQPHHPPYALADGAIAALRSQNKKLFLMPQNLVELWTVATRPMDVNGLGMSTAAAQPGDLFDMETPGRRTSGFRQTGP